MVSSKKHLGEVDILKCQGDLDALSMVVLKNKLRKLMEKKRTKVVLDLSQTRNVDFAGLGILVERIKEIRQEKGDIRLCKLKPTLKRTFKLVGVSKLIDSYPSQHAAARSFEIA